jgi:ankyrin
MKGADVNFEARQNITPLHVAAKWGKANSVNLLLDNNAKIDAKTRVCIIFFYDFGLI